MAVVLTVNGVSYNYPTGNGQLWGEDATNWAIAITDAVNSAVVDGDIAPPSGSSFSVDEVQAVATDVTNLVFDSSVTRAATIEFYIYRIKGAVERVESGILQVSFTDANGWSMSDERQGDETNVELSITSGGQIQYTSTSVGGTGTHTGVMKFRARALPKED